MPPEIYIKESWCRSDPITKTEESKLKDEESKEEEMKVDEAVDTYCEDFDLEFEAVQRSYAKSN